MALSICVTVPSLMLGTNAQRPPSVTGPGVCPTFTCATIVQVGVWGDGCEHATIEAPAFTDNDKAVLRFTDDVVRNVRASDKNLKAVQAFLSAGALVELTLTIGYYMMVCRVLETTGVEGEEGQEEWRKTARL